MFARFYRTSYLVSMVANLVLMLDWLGFDGIKQNFEICSIDIFLFAINLFSWLGYSRGKEWAFELERILSSGRILMILIGATLFGADVAALFSAVGLILWYEVMLTLLAKSYYLYWAGCATLLLLECKYLWTLRLSSNGQSDEIALGDSDAKPAAV